MSEVAVSIVYDNVKDWPEPDGVVPALRLAAGADEVEPSYRQAVLLTSELQPEDADDAAADEEIYQSTDIVQKYLYDIGRVALLSAEKEVELAKRIEVGLFAAEKLRQNNEAKAIGHKTISWQLRRDYELLEADGARARTHLTEANLRLVVSIAKRYNRDKHSMTLLDLAEEGNIGLVRAVEKFDYTKGYKFSTYATWWIRQAIQRSIADKDQAIRVPVHAYEQIAKMTRREREMFEKTGVEPTDEALADDLAITVDRLAELRSLRPEIVSYEQEVGDGGESRLGDYIADKSTALVETAVTSLSLQEKVGYVLAELPPLEESVMRKRFGFDGDAPKTCPQISKELGIPASKVSSIQSRILRKLRATETIQPLKDYLSES